MTLPRLALSAILVVASLSGTTTTVRAQTAITQDPAPDKTNPALIDTFQLPSHGSLLNALVYVASGPGPHPVVVLLHGFPGNEKNLDLAQALRRAGYDVLYFDYRGSWGTPGDFTFTHTFEDTQAAVAYLHDPTNAKRLRADPGHIILIGHSMGGMIAANVAALDPSIEAIGLISAANMAGRVLPAVQSGHADQALAPTAKGLAANGMAPLAGCTPESLAKELIDHAAAWDIPSLAPKLGSRHVLIISSDDGNTPSAEALAANLVKAGNKHVTSIHIATDHSYSDHRIALEKAVLDNLQTK